MFYSSFPTGLILFNHVLYKHQVFGTILTTTKKEKKVRNEPQETSLKGIVIYTPSIKSKSRNFKFHLFYKCTYL